MTYQAVLFDLDGTLLDTIDDLADSMNLTLGRMGFPTHEVEAYKYFVGDGVEALAERALPAGRRDPQTVGRCVQGHREEYSRCWMNKTRPYDGIGALLDALAERGIKRAILSNKPDDSTKLVVGKLLADWDFDVVRGALDGVRKKPDPTGAIRIASELATPPADFLYLGDTNTDMLTANGAGMFAVGALWGFRTADELIANGAKVLIEKPTELLNLF